MLQPTSPFRNHMHIKKSIDIFSKNKCDSVVSVVSVDGYHPFRMKKINKEGNKKQKKSQRKKTQNS